MSNPSFSAGHAVLRKLALRTTCSTAGLSKMAVWGFLAGGGFFVFLGMAIDALWVQHSSPGPGSLVAWAAYVCIVAFFLFHSRGPVVIVGTPYFRTRRFDRSVLAVHGLSMLAMLMWSQSFFLTVVFEALWLVFWVASLLGHMWLSTKPMALGLWLSGSVCVCNERDMVLEAVRSWEWWDALPNEDKKALWAALPDWKWELHSYMLEKQYDDMAERVGHWIDLETHPYWNAVRTMNTDDIATSIQLFLRVRDGGQAAESYACEL